MGKVIPFPVKRYMTAHIYHNSKHTRLRVSVSDLEQLIARCGWDITSNLEGITPEARAEIDHLDNLDSLPIGEDREWWQERVIDVTPCDPTPDM